MATKKIRKKKTKIKSQKPKPSHGWRLCPPGEHWRRTHSLKIPPSKKNPTGGITTRHGHCVLNPTGRDQLYPDEMLEISERNFSNIKQKPCPFGSKFDGLENKFDHLIAGWTQYWNEVLHPEIPLSPNVVKALIASESSFNYKILAKKNDPNSARGLMQVTNKTRKILGDEDGELKDHFLTLTREDLNDPNNNICAGIRWLFRKQEIATSLLGRPATWVEAVAEFKGARRTTKTRAAELMDKFIEVFEILEKCQKK